MRRIFHVSHSITGPLRNWSDDEWDENYKSFSHDGKILNNGRELRNLFVNELINGNYRIPIGDCSNFDPKRGCRGHIFHHPDAEDNYKDFIGSSRWEGK